MKKLSLLSLLLALSIAGCKKEKGSGPVWFTVSISLLDSSGALLFPEPPPNYRKYPFDPDQSYWISGTGEKIYFRDRQLSGNAEIGLRFGMSQQYHEFNQDKNYLATNIAEWTVVFNPDSPAYTLKVVNPNLGTQMADYIIWNEDTLAIDHIGGYLEIAYP